MDIAETVTCWQADAQAYLKANNRPMVCLSYAQSLDGCLSLQRGMPTALSGAESSRLTHRLRAVHDAILVGIGTVLSDDPRLTVRLVAGKHPQPVILDSHLRTPLEAKLIQDNPLPAWIGTTAKADPGKRAALEARGVRLLDLPTDASGRIQLPALLDSLANLGIASLMVEGGARVITSFLTQGLADRLVLTIAPRFLGGLSAVEPDKGIQHDLPSLRNVGYQRLGDDLIVWGDFPRKTVTEAHRMPSP
jgi:3,4-dihydroxy 2-butanone 4-phosphate synthase/GTP cyclohydrolase II